MSDNNQRFLEALTAATNKQTTALNRLGNSLELFVKKVGEAPAAFAESARVIAENTKTIADGTKAVLEYYANSEKHWSEMATNIGEIRQGLNPSTRTMSQATSPFGQLIDLGTVGGIKTWQTPSVFGGGMRCVVPEVRLQIEMD